ncbi:DUF126 domain-containing protein [Acuticoccus sp. MNP-M23]|uniref:aconitase X swivel domain-containing protein n=1 Tax=Acuticoccus sp. MNP-M23 TaxID=3072793 RepID=UPI00281546A7|nr:DUF126 domain-containing protein [Acuticoccus sp. MNP-M23]WMS41995.1 DUF126 domain-containing protein [Acuticoccus sp. MNP-M23]
MKGPAAGPALLSDTPLSFLGDLDIATGRVVGQGSDLIGQSVAGTVLVLRATRGSAGAWRFLYQLKRAGTHPAAIVLEGMPDPSVVQGAILSFIPVIANIPADLRATIAPGTPLSVDGASGMVRAE